METKSSKKNGLVKKKRRLDRILVGLAVLTVLALTVLQTYVVRLGSGVSLPHSILIFGLININIILLFLLLLLVLRNLYKIFFEQRQIIGAQLRTKLVVAFVSLSMVPTFLLFYTAFQFITTAHEYWFDRNVERALVDSLVLGQYLADINESFVLEFGGAIRTDLLKKNLLQDKNKAALQKLLEAKRRDFHLAFIELWSADRQPTLSVREPGLNLKTPPHLPTGLVNDAVAQDRPSSKIDVLGDKDLLRVIWSLKSNDGQLLGFLNLGYVIAAPVKSRMKDISRGLEGYRELKRLQDPIRISHYIALTIVALLSVFVSTWIGFHLAKGITGPIMELAQATERISLGDYDFTITVANAGGEIETLVQSFNRMTRDLKAGKSELEAKNIQLQSSNTELEQRRRYMEIVLQNVAAGVISTDPQGNITTINNSAEEILQVPAERVLGRNIFEVNTPDQGRVLKQLIKAAQVSPKGSAEKQVRIMIGSQGVSLHTHLTLLKDENGQEIGLVIVFDDLSELEKAQRMAAWREVARRIAHEIKNPLTPIQLSTQRLRRKYGDWFQEDGQLFDECTLMIIRQVEELKRLVNEFSNFARMPEANPTPNDLAEIVDETLVLYRDAHREVRFFFKPDHDLPAFNLDREQIKRVLINLLDNAVAAVGGQGRIDVNLDYDKLLRLARLEVVDDGTGISPDDRRRLFEPYFSTKKSGTGLGLAIVSTIVADHDGFVRVQDNHPRGTKFIVELPVKT